MGRSASQHLLRTGERICVQFFRCVDLEPCRRPVVEVHNGSAFLTSKIESLLAQDYPPERIEPLPGPRSARKKMRQPRAPPAASIHKTRYVTPPQPEKRCKLAGRTYGMPFVSLILSPPSILGVVGMR